MISINLLLVAILIILTAFFVATEFAIIRIRPSRIEQLVLEGNKRAINVQKVTSNLDGYLSACQLGITITGLGLGWLGEPTVERILHPVFEYFHLQHQLVVIFSFLLAFGSITFLHVVLGELAPKTVAIQKYGYVNRIFTFDELHAREIMVPRTDMICLYKEKPLQENLKIIKEEKYTRFPVVSENKDNVIGIINTKEFFLKYADDQNLNLETLIRPALTVFEGIYVKDLLKEMQKNQVHIAILIDEYGGTSGLVTIEDILEEIVGDIRDEFDTDDKPEIEKLGENHFVVDGKVLISEINELLKTDLENDEFDTIGGWIYSNNPVIKEGEQWEYGQLTFRIKKKVKHRIHKVEIIKNA